MWSDRGVRLGYVSAERAPIIGKRMKEDDATAVFRRCAGTGPRSGSGSEAGYLPCPTLSLMFRGASLPAHQVEVGPALPAARNGSPSRRRFFRPDNKRTQFGAQAASNYTLRNGCINRTARPSLRSSKRRKILMLSPQISIDHGRAMSILPGERGIPIVLNGDGAIAVFEDSIYAMLLRLASTARARNRNFKDEDVIIWAVKKALEDGVFRHGVIRVGRLFS